MTDYPTVPVPTDHGVLSDVSEVGNFVLGGGTVLLGVGAVWALRRRKPGQTADESDSEYERSERLEPGV